MLPTLSVVYHFQLTLGHHVHPSSLPCRRILSPLWRFPPVIFTVYSAPTFHDGRAKLYHTSFSLVHAPGHAAPAHIPFTSTWLTPLSHQAPAPRPPARRPPPNGGRRVGTARRRRARSVPAGVQQLRHACSAARRAAPTQQGPQG